MFKRNCLFSKIAEQFHDHIYNLQMIGVSPYSGQHLKFLPTFLGTAI
jgi:hypothetical protein